tara:strand:- start:288 stop:1082 length:795 start_codon:yes stop_codon:yes gene_type:complete
METRNLANDPVDKYSSEYLEQLFPGEKVNGSVHKYIRAEPDARKHYLSKMNDEKKQKLYDHYTHELKDAIDSLRQNNCLFADHAQGVLDQVEVTHRSIWQKYKSTKYSDYKLLNVLHQTAALISTPMMTESNEINPKFTKQAANFSGAIAKLKTNGRHHALKCAGYALAAVFALAATAFLSVMTFGAFGAAITTGGVLFGLINIVGQGGFGLYLGGGAFKFFNKAQKSLSLAGKMDKLSGAMQGQQAGEEASLGTPLLMHSPRN